MSKQAIRIAAIILLSGGGSSLSTSFVSAQSFPPNAQPSPYEYGLIDYMDGTRDGCRIYSQAAQWQANDNRYFRCGYSGARWDINRDMHFWWCRLVHRRTSILAELQKRQMSLQLCLDRIEWEVPVQPVSRPAF